MSYTTICHPSEEILVDCALHETNDEVQNHLFECTECNSFVQDVQMMKEDIAGICDEEIPQYLENKVLAIAKLNRPENYLYTFLQNWYKNPFLIGIITAIAAVLSYVIFTIFL
jgi:hypothetical protein